LPSVREGKAFACGNEITKVCVVHEYLNTNDNHNVKHTLA